MPLDLTVIDYETFYSEEFTLKKHTTESYIRDPRFRAHGAAIKWSPSTPARWYSEAELRHIFKQEDWSTKFVVNHHAQFDALISSHHYGVHPAMVGCTLSMARLMLGNHISVSLDSVRAQFGIPAKITPYNLMIGKQWEEMTPQTQELVADGACDEVESIYKIFCILMAQGFPPEELEIVDSTIKMFSEPCLQADVELLRKIWVREAERKQALLSRLGVSAGDLSSADKFCALLRARGVEIEMKPGKPLPDGTPKLIPAISKTDTFMEELLTDEDDEVRFLAEARLGIKSTLLQTRAETLAGMQSRGSLAVYLRYAGAHTSRWSGGDGCLSGDTVILVFDYQKGLTHKRIVDVLADDLVWDGEEFVSHDGVKFNGYRDTISYDGISGTPDHQVYTKTGPISLSEANAGRQKIMVARSPTRRQVEAAERGEHG